MMNDSLQSFISNLINSIIFGEKGVYKDAHLVVDYIGSEEYHDHVLIMKQINSFGPFGNPIQLFLI